MKIKKIIRKLYMDLFQGSDREKLLNIKFNKTFN